MGSRRSIGGPTRWRGDSPEVTRRRASAAATWWPLCRSSASPSGCPSSRRAAARRSNFSRARRCPASPPCATRIMRKPLIAGNWKMHFTVPEGLEYALQLRRDLEPYSAVVDAVILPPAVMLWEIANALRGCAIEFGAQNAGWEDQGPFTGEISPKMLAGRGPYLLIGHSGRPPPLQQSQSEIKHNVHAA